jgi:DNA-binding NarL/FixJ family response regulator
MGYIIKNCTYDQLIHAINMVYSGKKYLSEEVTESLIDDYLEIKKSPPVPDPILTKREIEVLNLIAKGIPTKKISEVLFISIKTVGSHKQKILEKLNLKTNADLIKFAIKKGMTSIE